MGKEEEQFIFGKLDLVMEFRYGLSAETDRGCALMAAEYLSDQLAELLRSNFVDDDKVCDPVFDGATGALSTFSSRIDFGYLLGHIGPVARRELHLIRKIRNEFAHEYKPLTFTNDAIAARCRELRAYVFFPDPPPRTNFIRSAMGLLAIIHGSIAVAKHARVSKDLQIKFLSGEAQHEVKGKIRQRVGTAFAKHMKVSKDHQIEEKAREEIRHEIRQFAKELFRDSVPSGPPETPKTPS